MIENKKASIILILKVLEEYSDEEHYLTQAEIIKKVSSIYNIDIERKSVAYSISLLIELGYDIVKGNHGGYALLSRMIDNVEAKYLLDAIYSSKSITSKQAKNLAEKITSNLSSYQRKDYNYLIKSNEINRTNNNQIFYSLELIQEAIRRNKRICFSLLTYDESGNEILRMNGYKYIVSPYYLINNFGRYYLLCNYREKYSPLNVFRLDYIVDLEILEDKDIKPLKSLANIDPNFKIENYINDHIYMLGGDTISATLEIENVTAIRYIKDYFGNNAKLSKKDNKIIYNVKANEQSLVYFIMQYGENIKVLEPSTLIDKILECAKRSFSKYLDEK